MTRPSEHRPLGRATRMRLGLERAAKDLGVTVDEAERLIVSNQALKVGLRWVRRSVGPSH